MWNNPRLSTCGLWLALAFLPAMPLVAQSYATSFDQVKFDRAKSVATFHNNVQVDGTTGALSASWPLGPGIGARGVTYRPTVNLRWAANYSISSALWNAVDGYTQVAGSYSEGAASLAPGKFDLVLDGGYAAQAGPVTNWELPDGSTGVLAGVLPGSVPGGLQPALTDIQGVLLQFGYAGYTRLPPVAPGTGPFIGIQNLYMGSHGELVVYLCKPGKPQGNSLSYSPDAPNGGGGVNQTFTYPDVILVIQGNTAYEFSLAAGGMTNLETSHLVQQTPDAGPTVLTYSSACPSYGLTRMLNRAGEYLNFDYKNLSNTPGRVLYTGYTVSWSGSSATVDVEQTATGMTVRYNGLSSNNPSFTIAATQDPYAPGDFWHALQITSISDDNSHEAIGISYGTAPSPDLQSGCYGFTTISQIAFPNRNLNFTWQAYPYARNRNSRDWEGFNPAAGDAWFCGVTVVDDVDAVSYQCRRTTHTRTLPQLQPLQYSTMPGVPTYCYQVTNWQSTAFNDVITQADGSTVVSLYATPPFGTDMDNLLFLKHVPLEVRTYEPNKYVASDLAVPAEQSVAYQIVRSSQWKLQRLGNPAGSVLNGSVPYAGMTETFTRQNGTVLKHTETLTDNGTVAFDAVNFGWPQTQTVDEVDPDGGGGSLQAVTKVQNRDWYFDSSSFFPPRKVDETVTVNGDSTLSLAAGIALPFSAPTTRWTYTALNQVQTTTLGGSPESLTTTFNYGSSGMAQLLAQNLGLSGTGSGLTDPVGINQYGYDSSGFMNLIQQRGVPWNVQQTLDVFGRPTSQTDPNGNQTQITWDASGRLASLLPQDGSVPTLITYDDSSHRIVTVTRQAEKSEYHFNGYGELIQEIRYDGTTASNRVISYDLMGRKRFESVWRKDKSDDGAWPSASGTGTQITRDGQGRVIQAVDPNGTTTTSTYVDVLTTTTTVLNATVTPVANAVPVNRNLATTAKKDAAGRLVSLTDPKGQMTSYAYDPLNRIAQVIQMDPATGVTQTRSWAYDYLGRTVVLDQPESGVTYATDFDLLGKAHTVVYGLPAGWRPASLNSKDGSALSVSGVKVVFTTFDAIGRPITVTSSDGSVVQSFAYDNNQPGGVRGTGSFGQANGRRVYAQDRGVEQWFYYRTATPAGALDELDTNVWSGAAPQQGTVQSFAQSFTYDGYGKRLTATTDGRRVRQFYDDAMGAPLGANYINGALNGGGEQPVASAGYDAVFWGLLNVGMGSSLSTYTYDPDQVRLKTLTLQQGSSSTNFIYTYDNASRLLGTGEDTYGVDELGRLVQAQVQRLNGDQPVKQTFAYDAMGNQTSSQITYFPTESTFNGTNFTFAGSELAVLAQTNHLPGTANGVPTGAAYDAQGNLTTLFKEASGANAKQVNLGYDALGRVVGMSDLDKNVSEVYAYTADGLRFATQQYQNGSLQKTKFNVYNDARQLVSEYVLAPSGTNVTKALVRTQVKTLAASDGPDITAQISYTGATGILTGTKVYLSGSFTADCPVTRANYVWDFGDGTTQSGSTLTSVNHTYAAQGIYTVTLSVSPMGRQDPSCLNTVVPATLTFTVVNQPAITSFTSSASAINAGQGFTFSWSTANATALAINGTAVSGTSASWTALSTASYVLKATNTLNGVSFSVSSAPVTVTVYPVPTNPTINAFSAASTRIGINKGGTALSWSVTPGTAGTLAVTLNGVAVPASASAYPVNPQVTTAYVLKATSTSLNQVATVSSTVNVTVVQLPVITSFTASNPSPALGASTSLAWSVQNADTLTLNGDPMLGGMLVQGNLMEAPTGTSSYTLVASNLAGTVSATQAVTVNGTGALAWIRDVIYLGNRQVAEADTAGIHLIQTDHQGSPRYIINAAGVVESRQKFLPFGETLDQLGSLTTAKGFTGHEQTEGSGLIYMQARFYAAQYHRFTSPDPARDQHFEDTQSWNIYSYVRNMPTTMTDPTGMLMNKQEPDFSPAEDSTYDNNGDGAHFFSHQYAEELKQDQEAQTQVGEGNNLGLALASKLSQANPLSKDLTDFDPAKLSDAGKTDINKSNLSSLIYSLAGEMINGSTGLRSQIGDGVPIAFTAGTPENALGETNKNTFGKGYTITIDVNGLAGSLHALGAVVAHELQHVLTEIRGGGPSAMHAANVRSEEMRVRAEGLGRAAQHNSSSGNIRAYKAAVNAYMWNNPVETPSYQRQAEYLHSVGEF